MIKIGGKYINKLLHNFKNAVNRGKGGRVADKIEK